MELPTDICERCGVEKRFESLWTALHRVIRSQETDFSTNEVAEEFLAKHRNLIVEWLSACVAAEIEAINAAGEHAWRIQVRRLPN